MHVFCTWGIEGSSGARRKCTYCGRDEGMAASESWSLGTLSCSKYCTLPVLMPPLEEFFGFGLKWEVHRFGVRSWQESWSYHPFLSLVLPRINSLKSHRHILTQLKVCFPPWQEHAFVVLPWKCHKLSYVPRLKMMGRVICIGYILRVVFQRILARGWRTQQKGPFLHIQSKESYRPFQLFLLFSCYFSVVSSGRLFCGYRSTLRKCWCCKSNTWLNQLPSSILK